MLNYLNQLNVDYICTSLARVHRYFTTTIKACCTSMPIQFFTNAPSTLTLIAIALVKVPVVFDKVAAYFICSQIYSPKGWHSLCIFLPKLVWLTYTILYLAFEDGNKVLEDPGGSQPKRHEECQVCYEICNSQI